MSYVHFDDEHENRRLTKLRELLSAEVRAQTGKDFSIFQDRYDIAWGQAWQERINESIDSATLFIPIITPSFFTSAACRDELSRFLRREQQLHRNDLILPLYYIDTPLIDEQAKRAADALAEAVAMHNYADWRDFRFKPLSSPRVRKEIARLATQIRDAIKRMTTAPPLSTVAQALVEEPEVRIIKPAEGEHQPHAVHMEGTVSGLPNGIQLWIVKEPHPGNYHVDSGPVLIRGNTWVCTAYIGTDLPGAHQGKEFLIHVVAAPDATSKKFRDYVDNANATGAWIGLPTLYDGKIVATVTVIRDDYAHPTL
jgi:hypothetical protein